MRRITVGDIVFKTRCDLIPVGQTRALQLRMGRRISVFNCRRKRRRSGSLWKRFSRIASWLPGTYHEWRWSGPWTPHSWLLSREMVWPGFSASLRQYDSLRPIDGKVVDLVSSPLQRLFPAQSARKCWVRDYANDLGRSARVVWCKHCTGVAERDLWRSRAQRRACCSVGGVVEGRSRECLKLFCRFMSHCLFHLLLLLFHSRCRLAGCGRRSVVMHLPCNYNLFESYREDPHWPLCMIFRNPLTLLEWL